MHEVEIFRPTLMKLVGVLNLDQALKLDLYPESSIPGEFTQSVIAEVLPGLELPIAARSDAALSKLIWANHRSHKSRRDCREILRRASWAGPNTERRG